jgi:UDP-N-acetylmuramoyl-L-alanyl-D-glutamate--2,6-diaminopimelate ligase
VAELRARPDHRLITFSVADEDADFRARNVRFDSRGSRFSCLWAEDEVEVQIPLPGQFNVENALCALAIADGLGADVEAAAAALKGIDPIPGRFEPVEEGQSFLVLVDYAHTPDSLENVLVAARRLTKGRLISVFGCGGDRDREKRPLMGAIGAEHSDLVIVTSDNPRSEDPEAIIAEIVAGNHTGALEVEADRRLAIARALEAAADGDTVLIAGKGHETGQEFEAGRKIPFDDRDVARAELRRLAPT